jgi:hypothetical protein
MYRSQLAFYTVSDARFFLGTVGLLNSLRLVGHTEPLVILDCGLTDTQRALLAPHCQVVPFARDRVANPMLLKPFAKLLAPRGVVAILDSDMVLTQSLAPVLTWAAQGKICAFVDPLATRWFAEWETLFALPAPPRRQPYLNAGCVVLSTAHWPALLDQWWAACERSWVRPTLYEGADYQHAPTAGGDQDALNAVLMSCVPADAIVTLPREQAAARAELGAGVTITDLATLACTYRGQPTLLLHGSGKYKPWDALGWLLVPASPYVRLLRRLLTGPDVAVRVPPAALPAWLRGERTWAVRLLDRANRVSSAVTALPAVFPLARWLFRGSRRAAGLARRALLSRLSPMADHG